MTTTGNTFRQTQIECPACAAAGLMAVDGHVARLRYQPSMNPPYRCPTQGIGFTRAALISLGVHPSRFRQELPDEIPGVDEQSRERWEDESPASTLARPGSGVDPTPLA